MTNEFKKKLHYKSCSFSFVPLRSWPHYNHGNRRNFFCVFVVYCLLENFHSYGDVTIAGEGLQIFTFARHSRHWAVGVLNCYTGQPFIMVIWHSHLLPGVNTYFYDLNLSRPGIEPRSPAREANALPLRHCGGSPQYGCNTANTAKTLMNQLIYPSYEVLDQL